MDGGLAGGKQGATLVVGSDGRYFASSVIQTVIRIAAANGVSTVMIGQFGVMTTPAISLAIRDHRTDGGIVISAGRRLGGKQGLFGIKLCLSNGGPADDIVNSRIYQLTKTIKEYYTCTKLEVKLNRVGEQVVRVGAKDIMRIIVFDSVKEYGKCMQSLFDFWQMRALFSGSITGNPVRLMIDGRNGGNFEVHFKLFSP
ncbi:PGM PMM I domain containing protein [Trichuris trichiura]|uniref:PGM PMM I domain containing protein n=1 Tax=Trichuris trichiura TaxID=36087 RepID=A0A077ZQR8_TRITR|nr:PGM PMM I domain containing protein [Trichuris trichiura]